ncbi:uncharacterized protein [Nicotiana sylvestris]|uniref:uncharacterized protein n=1 Tax=Nicotiana sylvestris TaxID=4096 RepID=UPI00388C6A0A
MRKLGRCQVMHPDEDLSVYAVEVSSDGQFHEETVRSIWNECQYLTVNTRVHDLSRGEISPAYLAWYRKKNSARAEQEKPAKKPYIQELVEASQEQWAWLAKENEYRATIRKLEKQVKDLQFENGLQATVDEGEKKKLAKENEALRAQIRETKTTAENPDEKLINNLRQKVDEYGFYLNKAEGELARARTKLAKNAEERARLVKQLKEKYDNEVAGLKKRVITVENKMIKQANKMVLSIFIEIRHPHGEHGNTIQVRQSEKLVVEIKRKKKREWGAQGDVRGKGKEEISKSSPTHAELTEETGAMVLWSANATEEKESWREEGVVGLQMQVKLRAGLAKSKRKDVAKEKKKASERVESIEIEEMDLVLHDEDKAEEVEVVTSKAKKRKTSNKKSPSNIVDAEPSTLATRTRFARKSRNVQVVEEEKIE